MKLTMHWDGHGAHGTPLQGNNVSWVEKVREGQNYVES